MGTKVYDEVTVRKEGDVVILIKSTMIKPLIIKRSTFRQIVADNVKEVMRGNDET